MNGDKMNGNELIDKLINDFSNIQRVITADDPVKEAEYQLKLIKAKLEAMGIPTTDLNIK